MSVVHRLLSRKAHADSSNEATPSPASSGNAAPLQSPDGPDLSGMQSAPLGHVLHKQLDEIEALLETQEREQEQLRALMDQLEEKLGAVETILTRGAGEEKQSA